MDGHCRVRVTLFLFQFKQQELVEGAEIEVDGDLLRFNCSATWGVYIRSLKKWDSQ
jgi:hypothetical protein